MKETGILFSGPMVRAILDGRKAQTRRVARCFDTPEAMQFDPRLEGSWWKAADHGYEYKCPYGEPGDRLWVRETWRTHKKWDDLKPSLLPIADEILIQPYLDYRATSKPGLIGKWRPSIFMPRWASRITLELTKVRCERVQDICESDAIAEGIVDGGGNPVPAFVCLWDELNAKRSFGWDTNPFVWALTFKRLTP